MLSKFILALLAVFALISVISCQQDNSLSKHTKRMDADLEQLNRQYATTIENVFWNKQKTGDKLIEGGEQTETGYVLKEISRLLTAVEIRMYAIERRGIEAVKRTLEKNWGINIFNDLDAYLLESRVSMRSSMDGSTSAAHLIAPLFKLIKYYVVDKDDVPEELVSIATDVFGRFHHHYVLGHSSFEEYKDSLDKLKDANPNMEEEYISEYLKGLDTLIDSETGCSSCYQGKVYIPEYLVGTMFTGPEEIEKVVSTYVEPTLASALEQSKKATEGHFIKIDPKAVLEFKDLTQLNNKFLRKYAERFPGLQHQ